MLTTADPVVTANGVAAIAVAGSAPSREITCAAPLLAEF
jgi:hypothetical protein